MSATVLTDFNDHGADAAKTAIAKALVPSVWSPAGNDRFNAIELTEPPPPQAFIVKPYLPSGCACVLTGAGGTSKTGLMVALAVSICTGEPFLGEHVTAGSVLIATAEDRRETLRRHVFANTRHLHDIAPVTTRLFVKDLVGLDAKMTRQIDGETLVAGDVADLIDFALTIPDLRLVVLDTLSRLNGGSEDNEGLARFVEAMERIARETGATVLAAHHTGKQQMRDQMGDQYGGRGGSALSDNARSVLHLARVTADTKPLPANASELIAAGRLLKLSHVKSNYASPADDVWLERRQTPHAARIEVFTATFGKPDTTASTWTKLADWLTAQTEVTHPTKATLEALGREYGSRATIRAAIQFAIDRGHLIEHPHPHPTAGRKTFLAIVRPTTAADYRRASGGE